MAAEVQLNAKDIEELWYCLGEVDWYRHKHDAKRLDAALDDLQLWRAQIESRPRERVPDPAVATMTNPEADEPRPGPVLYRPAAKTVEGVLARLRGGGR